MLEPKRLLKVFLCHARDDKSKARELYRYLRKHSIQPWLDAENLLSGEDWRVEIPKAIKASDAIIICLSKNSINKEGYVQAEITFALEKALEIPQGRIFIIPARFEECEVPNNLERYHWVDLFEANGYAKLMKSLKTRAAQLERAVVEIFQADETNPNLPGKAKSGLAEPVGLHNETVSENFPRPRIPIEVDSQEVFRFFRFIESALNERFKTLEKAGIIVQKNVDVREKYSYQVRYKNNLIYHFSMCRSGRGDLQISFLDGWTEPIHENASTAFGTIYATLDNPEPRIQITNLSLLEIVVRSADLTYQELIEEIWTKAVNIIEQGRKQLR